jgi:hypothetical protein
MSGPREQSPGEDLFNRPTFRASNSENGVPTWPKEQGDSAGGLLSGR